MIERAPVVDLWLRSARRKGATITYGVPDGRRRRARHRPRRARATARRTSTTCRARRTAAASPTPGAPPATASPSTRSRACSSSRATRRRRIPPCARWRPTRSSCSASACSRTSFRGIADLVLPGTSYLERDGTTVNLEGRLQRQRRAVVAPVPDVTMPRSRSSPSGSSVEVSPHVSVLFDEVAGEVLRRDLVRRRRRAGRAAAAGRSAPDADAGVRHPRRLAPAGCGSSPTGRSSPAPRSSARPSSSSSSPTPRSSSRARTRRRAGSATARRSPSRRTARRSSCARGSRATSQAGVVRVAARPRRRPARDASR